MVTLPFLNVRDVVVVLIVAGRNRSESTLVVFQTLMHDHLTQSRHVKGSYDILRSSTSLKEPRDCT